MSNGLNHPPQRVKQNADPSIGEYVFSEIITLHLFEDIHAVQVIKQQSHFNFYQGGFIRITSFSMHNI